MTPPKLRKGDKDNFATLKRAFLNGDVALVSAIRKSDQTPVALICAMSKDGETLNPTPLAVMIEGNPYKLFDDPTV